MTTSGGGAGVVLWDNRHHRAGFEKNLTNDSPSSSDEEWTCRQNFNVDNVQILSHI